ncbi:MAG: endonuclease/exonuclease/phosphatase family metal-dependent hydrolase [Candidatus Latescibacterota bacterium]|jgi:endonuclease/exonuclease/phosphatase family metal-dependent hydrolase
MRIATCNIRCFPAKDGPDHWELRKEYALNLIRSLHADIVCFQELWRPQYDYAHKVLPEYASFGLADEAATDRPVNALFWRRDAFDLVSPGGFWLSETPHISGSSSWDSACVRLANWLRLKERASGREFRVVNTHLDHISQWARENQARLICEDAVAYSADYPQLLTGDMNCDRTNAAIATFESAGWRDTYADIHGPADPGHSYHAFEGPAYKGDIGKMDWIFCRGDLKVTSTAIIDESCEGRFPSDHYFVVADVEL